LIGIHFDSSKRYEIYLRKHHLQLEIGCLVEDDNPVRLVELLFLRKISLMHFESGVKTHFQNPKMKKQRIYFAP